MLMPLSPKVFTQQKTEWFVYKPDLSFQKTGGKAENYFVEKRVTDKKWIGRILIRQ